MLLDAGTDAQVMKFGTTSPSENIAKDNKLSKDARAREFGFI